MERLDLEKMGQLKLADEPEEEKPKPRARPAVPSVEAKKPSGGVAAVLEFMSKRAEENRENRDEIYPSWDLEASGKSFVLGVLVEKRTAIVKGEERRMLIIDNQSPITATDRDGEYKGHTGLVTVWCNAVLNHHYNDAEIGKFTYINYKGRTKSQQSGRFYHDFDYAQADKEELAKLVA